MPLFERQNSVLDVFLEGRERRHYVGRLTRMENGSFKFEYDDSYRLLKNALPIGPNLPLTKKEYFSKDLFTEFIDRLPSKQNSAYGEYCASVGISPDESDLMVLLTKLGKGGPSKFVITDVLIEREQDVINKIKNIAKTTSLTLNDLSISFDLPRMTFHRVMHSKSKDKHLLRLLKIYISNPGLYLELLENTGGKLLDAKRKRLTTYLKNSPDGCKN